MLYERQATIAMPTCDSMRKTEAAREGERRDDQDETRSRPRPTSRADRHRARAARRRRIVRRSRPSLALAFPRAEQALRPEDQDQHEQQVRQDRRDLRDRQLQERVVGTPSDMPSEAAHAVASE